MYYTAFLCAVVLTLVAVSLGSDPCSEAEDLQNDIYEIRVRLMTKYQRLDKLTKECSEEKLRASKRGPRGINEDSETATEGTCGVNDSVDTCGAASSLPHKRVRCEITVSGLTGMVERRRR